MTAGGARPPDALGGKTILQEATERTEIAICGIDLGITAEKNVLTDKGRLELAEKEQITPL